MKATALIDDADVIVYHEEGCNFRDAVIPLPSIGSGETMSELKLKEMARSALAYYWRIPQARIHMADREGDYAVWEVSILPRTERATNETVR